MALLNFKHGLQKNLTTNSPAIAPGTVYVTRDERAMYVDLPEYIVDGVQQEAAKRIRIGDMRVYEYLTEMKDAITADMNELTKSALYFARYDKNGDDKKEINALLKWNGEEFVQLNTTSALSENLDSLMGRVGILETNYNTLNGTVGGHTTSIEGISNRVTETENRLNTLEGDASTEGSVDNKIATAIASKADTSALENLSTTVNNNKAAEETARAGLQSQITENANNITNLQNLVTGTGEGSISKQISAAVEAEKQAREAADETHTTNITNNTNAITQINTNLGNIETEIGGIKSDYLTKADASNTYLTKTDAGNTYATKTELNTAKSDLLGDANTDNTILYVKKLANQGISDAAAADTKASGIGTELTNYKTSNNAAVAGIKTTAENALALGQAAATQTKLTEEINRATAKENELSQAIGNEVTAREGAISALDERLIPLEAFIGSVEIGKDEVVDTLQEIIDFINTDETTASAMLADINKNKKDISDIQTNYATNQTVGALATEVENNTTCLTWSQF